MKFGWVKAHIKSVAMVTIGLMIPVSINYAYADNFTWTRYSSIPTGQFWSSIISDNGNIIIASSRSSYLVRSSNGGSSWTSLTSLAAGSYFLAMSKDGTKIFASANESGGHYLSSDSGATWTSLSPGAIPQRRPCMSDDGVNLMITPWGANPRYSSDSGATWSNVPGLPSTYWISCAMSADGSIRYAINNGSVLYRSSDSGATWQTTTVPSYPNDIGISENGEIVYILINSTKTLKKSTDFGASFSNVSTLPTLTDGYSYIATSGDASKILVFDRGSYIKSSVDGGQSWSNETSLGANADWYLGDVSNNGLKVVVPVAANGNYVWGSSLIAPSQISLTNGSAQALDYRTTSTITATTNYAGKVTFYANGKKIGKCVAVPTVSLVATCNYKPTIHGAVTISARFVPTNVSYSAISSELFRTKVQVRSNTR